VRAFDGSLRGDETRCQANRRMTVAVDRNPPLTSQFLLKLPLFCIGGHHRLPSPCRRTVPGGVRTIGGPSMSARVFAHCHVGCTQYRCWSAGVLGLAGLKGHELVSQTVRGRSPASKAGHGWGHACVPGTMQTVDVLRKWSEIRTGLRGRS
jgi:hypothetical protein